MLWKLLWCCALLDGILSTSPFKSGAQAVDNEARRVSFRGTANQQEVVSLSSDADQADGTPRIPLASMTVPLHSHSGTHHVFVHVGSPKPQRQTLILDTGSRYMAFPCEPWCKNCGNHHSPKFNGTKSTTLSHNEFPNCIFAKKRDPKRKDNSCIFHQTYLEGSSWTAKECEDVLWLGTWDQQESTEEYMPHLAIPFTFGCQTSVTGHFTRQYADGILGMARSLDENAFLNTMVKSNAIDRAAFATCLTREGGTLSLGGSGLARNDNLPVANQFHLEPMAFTNIIQEHGLYSMQISKVYVGDVCITCEDDAKTDNQRLSRRMTMQAFQAGKGVLLDSGTTDTFLPRHAYAGFAEAWMALSGIKMRERRVYTYNEFLNIPDISMVFEPNVTLVIPASSYMDGVPLDQNASLPEAVKPWMGSRRLTMRIYCEEAQGAVLGANAMYNYEVLYDLQDKRIGLARAYCG